MREELEILLHLFIIFAAAKIFAEIFTRIKQPIVIGELIAGAVIGAHGLGLISTTPVNDAIAELGVIFLLFLVGLETRMDDMREVGRPAILVGFFGVLIPLIMGYGLYTLFGYDSIRSLFMGTALVATSIGITARVLGDMGLLKHRTSRIILGAAILDDILGLLVLALVSSLAKGGFNYVEFIILVVEAVFFVLFLTTLGPKLAGRHIHKFIDRLRISEAPFAIGIILVLGLSVLAEYIGLAAIIGAFLAGIVLSETKDFLDLENKFRPVGNLLIPIFFVVMGTKFDILGLLTPSTIIILMLTVIVAVVSKMIGSAIGTIGLGFKTALQTGIGMVPRGEVGIVVGTIGLSLGVIGKDLYGIVLGMSILTTVVVP
ncbi:MAG TPA: cation:proton antiporter, partial [Actinobacteria bacterium]|nr:cation:proton antiporter [Actinomycetota bacterium]